MNMSVRHVFILLVVCVCVTGNTEPSKFITVNDYATKTESLPAKDDPTGNWGSIIEGVQLSIRFTNQVYRVGEPCIATILWRNTTNHTVAFCYSSARPEYFEFSVTDEKGTVLKSKSDRERSLWEPQTGRSSSRAVEPHSQMKFNIDLDKFFAFKPGKYRIAARYRFTNQSGSSAETTIRLEDQKAKTSP